MKKMYPVLVILLGFPIVSVTTDGKNIDSDVSQLIVFHNQNLIQISEEKLYQELENILLYLASQTEEKLQERVDVIFENPPREVTVDGMEITYNGGRGIVVYVSPGSNLHKVLGVLAHQLAFIYHEQWTGLSLVLPVLNKGVATLLSQRYWYRWRSIQSFTSAVQRYHRKDTYIPLGSTVTEREIEKAEERKIVYNEWAAFLRYLCKTYGKETFVKFLQQIAVKPEFGSAFDINEFFIEIYHQPLITLERAWLREIMR